MASLLLEELAKIARRRGITSLWAEVLDANLPMRSLFEKFGGKRERSHDTEGFVFQMDVSEIISIAEELATARSNRKRNWVVNNHTLGWYWSEICLAHDTGPGHVENAERYQVLGESLRAAAAELDAIPLRGRDIQRRELLRCHAAHYLDLVHIDVENLADQLRTGDTALSPQSERVALAAAGASIEAAGRVMNGEMNRVFVAVRPPGHHATSDRGMGFCIFNNVALMARHAQENYGCGNVLIVDWDVHHGNGTQEIFFSDSSVFFFSCHQEGIYPFSGSSEERGAGPGAGTTMNFPLPSGSGIDQILPLIRGPLTSAMEDFQPELVLISAGFDSRIDDPIGEFTLKDEDFVTLTHEIAKIADRWAGGRMISVLEGGYNPQGLASAAVAHFRAMAE